MIIGKSKMIRVIGVALVLVLATSAIAVNGANMDSVFNNPIVSKYFQSDETKLHSKIKALKTEELVNEINVLSENVPSEELIPFAVELMDRQEELDENTIIKHISDASKTATVKDLMIDLYNNKVGTNKGKIKALLNDVTINNETKAKIVMSTSFDGSDIATLKGLVKKNKDILSFSALKKLTLLDPAEASGIADNIMTNYASESDFRISAAQKSIARALKESNNKDRKQMFVKQCAEIFETGSSVTKDSSVFALSDMRDSNAITYILSNESIDRELKVFAIDQNANTLKKMISGNPSENDVRIAVDAMEILPLNDLLDELKAVQEKLEDPALKIRCEKAIAEIQQNGVDANQKWNQQ